MGLRISVSRASSELPSIRGIAGLCQGWTSEWTWESCYDSMFPGFASNINGSSCRAYGESPTRAWIRLCKLDVG